MRPRFLPSLIYCLVFPLATAPWLFAESAGAPTPGKGQLGAPITWVDLPGSEDLVHAVQLTRDGTLFLTPNESFFPKLGLAAEGTGSVPDVDELNGGKSFATIGKWDAGDSAEWGLWLTRPGKLTLGVRLEGTGGRFQIQVGEQSQRFAPSSGDRVAATAEFSISEPGRYSVTLT
ncbi:MAG: hypothetical protein KDM64_14225, partial [Verrucomicrobiae bacterium]|nr:hypothetical protein [Verrucomicrobiae bacterium]